MNNAGWLSPLIGGNKRVGGDMIAVVEIITGRLMRDALTKQGCRLLVCLKRTKAYLVGLRAPI